MLLTEFLDYNKMAQHVSKAASGALGLLIARTKGFGGLPYSTFTKLYDSLVYPAISYGAAIWGDKEFSCIGAVQNKACRYFLGVGKYAPNTAVMGDMGWIPTHVRQWFAVARQFCRLQNMSDKYISKRIFNWANAKPSKYNNWPNRVRKYLNEMG